ncbi:hypothetical protein AB0N06_35685 [Streptomyces sp. NPDC051020]|uniref:hypothetical protein n=1 Tax=Streptomyces sp. NPDC051020 TaxID=3155409 RepID=UPI00342BD237
MTSKAEVLRRMHHSYVVRRDLDGPEGELAVQVLLGCKAILRCRAVSDGDFIDKPDLERQMEALQWRALVTAAARGEGSGAQLLTRLSELEALAAAILELDTAFRQRNSDPFLGARIAAAVHGTKAVLRHWPPKTAEAVTEPNRRTP